MARSTREEVKRRINMMITEQEQFQNQLAVINDKANERSDAINEYTPLLLQGSEVLIALVRDMYAKF